MIIAMLPQPVLALDVRKMKPGAERAVNDSASRLLLALGWKAK